MRTYQSIAAQLGVDTPGWEERRVTSSGLYTFLGLAALTLHPELRDDPIGWRRIYLVHQAIDRLARRARVRIPFELTLLERRRVKAMLVGVPRDTPLRGRAFQWSRRRADASAEPTPAGTTQRTGSASARSASTNTTGPTPSTSSKSSGREG